VRINVSPIGSEWFTLYVVEQDRLHIQPWWQAGNYWYFSKEGRWCWQTGFSRQANSEDSSRVGCRPRIGMSFTASCWFRYCFISLLS